MLRREFDGFGRRQMAGDDGQAVHDIRKPLQPRRLRIADGVSAADLLPEGVGPRLFEGLQRLQLGADHAPAAMDDLAGLYPRQPMA